MKRSTGLALAAPALGLLLFAGACSSSGESSSDTSVESTTTTEATVESTTTTVDEVTTTTEAPTTSTTTSGGVCADVTEAEVQSALGSDTTIEEWHCATDAEGRPWVGGNAAQGPEGISENFILEAAADQSFIRASDSTMAACANPPIPSSLLTWCESN